ncbi:MAG: CD1871A family CXXC motif-containing protein [Anaerovoracaceae bacterium]|nr:CD1871A family CXXC motif-containing protein [Anaerovoracaceae bacterium]
MAILKKINIHLIENKTITPLLLVGAGVVFIVLGVYRGEVAIVFTKAVRICLECIGIG